MKVQRIVAAGLLYAAGMGLPGPGLAADPAAEALAALEREPLIVFPEARGRPLVRPLNAPRTVRVEYGRELDPTDFRATLNGRDVSAGFTPQPSRSETVTLPFQPGENELRIEVARRAELDADTEAARIMDRELHILRVAFEALQVQIGVRTEARPITDEEARALHERHQRGEPPSFGAFPTTR